VIWIFSVPVFSSDRLFGTCGDESIDVATDEGGVCVGSPDSSEVPPHAKIKIVNIDTKLIHNLLFTISRNLKYSYFLFISIKIMLTKLFQTLDVVFSPID